jgi:hypothetical protein
VPIVSPGVCACVCVCVCGSQVWQTRDASRELYAKLIAVVSARAVAPPPPLVKRLKAPNAQLSKALGTRSAATQAILQVTILKGTCSVLFP